MGRYLPELVPGERGQKITVRMLLNHTSHIAEYLGRVFPSVSEGSLASLDANRFRTFTVEELARLGLDGAATGKPGTVPGSDSNTNVVLAGLLLENVTGEDAERYITREVIHRASLRAIMSTMDDLHQFFRALLRGELIGAAQLAGMRKTVPMHAVGVHSGRSPTTVVRGQGHLVPAPRRERQRRTQSDRLRACRARRAGAVRTEHGPGQTLTATNRNCSNTREK